MAKPSGSMKTIQTTDGVDHEIIPDRLGNNGYVATPDTLAQDSSLIPVIDITASTFRIYGKSVGFYRVTQLTDVYIHATSSSSPYIVTARSGDIIHIVRIESGITYWVIYGGTYINAVTVGYVSSGTSVMYAPTLDVENIKNAYVKSASVSGDVLTLTLQDNSTITFTGGGGGGSVSIDNTSITENSSDQIQTVGVIDQKTGNANKQWTGTLAQYNALGTHDANTFYNITDDVGNEGNLVADITLSSAVSSIEITGLDINSDGGVYDFIIEGCNSTSQESSVYMKVNNISTSRYWEGYVAGNNSSVFGNYQSNVDKASIGQFSQNECFIKGSIMLSRGYPVYTTINWYLQSVAGTAIKNGGYYETISNITSLVFQNSTTFIAGTRIKIYKRSTNNARITS